MRIEKGYRHWKADLTYEQNPLESGLDRFVDLDKPNFVGKQGLLRQLGTGHRKLFVSMAVDCDSATAHGGDPIHIEKRIIALELVFISLQNALSLSA